MKTLILLLLLLALGAGLYWYLSNGNSPGGLREAEKHTVQQADQAASSLKDKLKGISSNAPDIKEELERTGKVVRKKAEQVGSAIADTAADARITATIKAKLLRSPHLSSLRIAVNTTNGVVTLSGSVDSVDQIQEALNLALETDGVREAISTLQVMAAKP